MIGLVDMQMQASLIARGWRAEVILALVVGLVAIGAATITWWVGTLADLAWRLGASCRASSIVDAVTSGAVAFILVVAMVKLGRWSRGAVPGVLGDDCRHRFEDARGQHVSHCLGCGAPDPVNLAAIARRRRERGDA